MILLLLACGADEPRSVATYLEAVEAGPAACAGIGSAELRGECVAMGAHELFLAGRTEAAHAACTGLEPGQWRDECFFLLADAEGVRGDRARVACAETGRFRFQCLGHAISREASVLFRESPRGEEARLLVELQALTGRYIEGQEAMDKAGRMLALELAARDPGVPFDLSLCGSAPEDLCRAAFVERVLRAAEAKNPGSDDQGWRQACARTVSVERAAAFGLPGWTEGADALVQEAWRELCRR